MALKHTILAFLTHESLSGYELTKEFADGFGSCFWKASQQQIYAQLLKLEQSGSVTYETVPQAGRLDKKIYSITQQGLDELTAWLAQPCEPTAIREDLGVMGLAGHLISSEAVIKEIERRQGVHTDAVQHLKRLDEPFSQDIKSLALKDLYKHLIIRRAIRYQESWVDWCEEALQVIKGTKVIP